MTRSRKADRIPVEPLRRAFLDSELTLSNVCYRLGWTKRRPNRNHMYRLADVSRLKRALGMAPDGRSLKQSTSYDHAQRIAQALDLDPAVVESWLPEPEPEPAGNHDACPECGTTATWRDSWDQERCERCWAIVRAASEVVV